MTLHARLRTTSRRALIIGPLGGLALVTAACGSAAVGTGYGPSSAAATPTSPPAASSSVPDYAAPAGSGTSAPAASAVAAAAITVKTTTTKLGTLLTDGQGKTLYLFEKDTAGTSACTGACIGVWPAFTTAGGVQAGPGVSMSLLSTIQRADGTTEVSYNGHPLYYYAGDNNPGDTSGQGLNQFGAAWYVVSPKGAKIDND